MTYDFVSSYLKLFNTYVEYQNLERMMKEGLIPSTSLIGTGSVKSYLRDEILVHQADYIEANRKLYIHEQSLKLSMASNRGHTASSSTQDGSELGSRSILHSSESLSNLIVRSYSSRERIERISTPADPDSERLA